LGSPFPQETQSKGLVFAQDLAARCMTELPEGVHWRVHLEMADLAKREKNFGDARRLYRRATELQPTAPQVQSPVVPDHRTRKQHATPYTLNTFSRIPVAQPYEYE